MVSKKRNLHAQRLEIITLSRVHTPMLKAQATNFFSEKIEFNCQFRLNIPGHANVVKNLSIRNINIPGERRAINAPRLTITVISIQLTFAR
jgi:hypothetical protein